MVSPTAAKAATAQATSETIITLLILTGDELAEPLRFALNDEDVWHKTDKFHRSGFQYKRPPEGETGQAIGSLRLDNVDRVLTDAIKGLTRSPFAQFITVLASNPDQVEETGPRFRFYDIGWNNIDIEGRLGLPDDSDEPSVSATYSPRTAPGLYG